MLFITRNPRHLNEGIRSALEKLGVVWASVMRPGILIVQNATAVRMKKIQALLKENRISFTTDKKEILSEKVKIIIRRMLSNKDMPVKNISVHISESLGNNYTYLSYIFSQVNGLTIEHYIIRCRIAKAKLLLRATNAGIGAVARVLHYSSIPHFSTQFKKITGMTPREYQTKVLPVSHKTRNAPVVK